MLKGKLIALAGALVVMVMAQSAGAANVALVGGDISPQTGSSVVVLSNTWRVETSESLDTWLWSVQCTGCVITNVLLNYSPLLGGVPSPPGTPGNIQWQAPSYTALLGSFPATNTGAVAGPIGFTTGGAPFAGNGLDVLVGWVTVHITAASGSVTPFFVPAQDGLFAPGAVPVPTTFSSVTWTPEPGTAMLIALGLGGLGIMGRRNR